jgi:phage-related protein
MARGDILIKVLGDTKDIQRKLGDLSAKSRSLSSVGDFAKKAAIGLGSLAVAAGYGAKKAIDAFGQSAAVGAQTAAVLKSTGGAARVSAGDIAEYASTLQSVTAFDDEAIQSGENLLLTFTNIQNRVGAGNDIFTQSTRTILDMSQALGQDMKSSAIQLGKALNDPEKGMTALRRVGVSFTQEQINQVKAMQATGDLMGAQKLILAELTKEFGGSAQAFANTPLGKIQQLKNTVDDTLEGIGQAIAPSVAVALDAIKPLLPILGEALTSLVKGAAPAFGVLVSVLKDLLPPLKPLVAVLGSALLRIFKALQPAIKPLVAALAGGLAKVLIALAPSLVILADLLAQLLVALIPILPPIFDLLALTLRLIALGLKPLAKVISIVLVPVIKILAAIIRAAGKVFTNFGGTVKAVWNGIKTAAAAAGKFIADKWEAVVNFFKKLPGRIAKIASGMWNGVKDAFKGVINFLIDAWNKLDFGIHIKVPKWVPLVGGKEFGVRDIFPDIPRLASGGIVRGGSGGILAQIGEGRFDEAVVPLRPGLGGFGGNVYSITVNVPPTANKAEIGKEVVEAIREYERRSGSRWRQAS